MESLSQLTALHQSQLRGLSERLCLRTALQASELDQHPLTSVMERFGQLTALHQNHLGSLPVSFCTRTALRASELDQRQLSSRNGSCSQLSELQQNQLSSLPESFRTLRALFVLPLAGEHCPAVGWWMLSIVGGRGQAGALAEWSTPVGLGWPPWCAR